MVARAHEIVIVGAGMGGLSAAIDLASQGRPVHVLERSLSVGGKARTVTVQGASIAAGPTVLTMQWVFEELFERSGRSLHEYVTLSPLDLLARHGWSNGSRLDLFADRARTADAIAAFAGGDEASRYVAFARHAGAIWDTAKVPFVLSQRPTFTDVLKQTGVLGLAALARIDGHRTMMRALAASFRDPRLIQLFGRYATYVGGSPFEAPATLNLISHVESQGVSTVRGGIASLAAAMATRARELGVRITLGAQVTAIRVDNGSVRGVVLATGEEVSARTVLFNADVSALPLLGVSTAAPVVPPADRSLSAFTLAVQGRATGFPLAHHTVLFSDDGKKEFDELLSQGRAPSEPTVYVCAEDRDASEAERPANTSQSTERFLLVLNAPATGDQPWKWGEEEILRCERSALLTLRRCGVDFSPDKTVVTTPVDFERAYPATGGALYGARPKGPMAAFSRSGARTRITGLYLAGGSVHPGAGVPMAALSGRLAAALVNEDLRSTERSSRAATSGTTQMA
jgi:1-hydroxycarotenoid 3,4-desaturase